MNIFSKIPLRLVVIAILAAAVGAVGAGLWVKRSRQQAQATAALPFVARVGRVDGQVGLNRSFATNNDSNAQWTEATRNAPVSVGDRIYARENSHAAIAFSGRNYCRLNPRTSLDVLSLSDRRTQLALRDGSALFDVGSLAPGDLFEVATPDGAVDFNQPGLYQVGIGDDGRADISVLSGLAQVAGLAGTGQVGQGEMLTLLGQTASQVALSRLDPGYAGSITDDYYSYNYPSTYDGRYRDYNAYLNDPYYYDQYRYTSYNYVPDTIAGVDDLDYYGDWQNVSGYGECWHPRVATGWAPYQQGYWNMDNPWGLTWVSSEPWGWAPYHYGRWAYVNNGWYWVPQAVQTQPVYAPALVAFVPLTQTNQIGWVPLGPGDPYVPRYYDARFQPQYLAPATATQPVNIVNLRVPGAVTVVPAQDFTRVISPAVITRVNPQTLAQARPVLDPLSVNNLRQVALQTAAARPRVAVPQVVAQKIFSTPVVTSARPVGPPVVTNLAQALKVQQVPENVKNQKLPIRDNRQAAAAQQRAIGPAATQSPMPATAPAIDAQQRQQMAQLAAQSARGNIAARRQLQQLQQQQQQQNNAARQPAIAQPPTAATEARNQQSQQLAAQRAQQEQLRQQQRAQRQSAPQQAPTAALPQQNRVRNQARPQAMPQRAQQAAVQRAQPAPARQPVRYQQQPTRPPQRAQQAPAPPARAPQQAPARPQPQQARVQQRAQPAPAHPQPQPREVRQQPAAPQAQQQARNRPEPKQGPARHP